LRGTKIEDTKRGKKFERTNVFQHALEMRAVKVVHYATLCYKQNTNSEFFEIGLRNLL